MQTFERVLHHLPNGRHAPHHAGPSFLSQEVSVMAAADADTPSDTNLFWLRMEKRDALVSRGRPGSSCAQTEKDKCWFTCDNRSWPDVGIDRPEGRTEEVMARQSNGACEEILGLCPFSQFWLSLRTEHRPCALFRWTVGQRLVCPAPRRNDVQPKP